MAEQHTLTIKAELDTSGIQGKLDQLNQQKQRAPGASSNTGVALTNQLTKLDRTLANLTRAVNQLAAGQKAASSLGTSAKSPVIVNAGGGPGPMIVPRISGRTITSTLMRDAVAYQMRLARSVSKEIFDSLTTRERQSLEYLHGDSIDGIFRKVLRRHISSLKTGMELDPAKTYHEIFAGKAGTSIPVMTKLRMLNQAPLAALGWGPKSWRAAQLAPQRIGFSTEAKKGIAGMAVGSMLSPALDFVTKYVAPDPTDWWHVGGTVAKHAGSRAATGALIGFGTGTATTGVGGVPAAGAGILVGGFIGLVEGVFDAWSEVKEYELKTAEDLKRYNDQIKSNWQKIAEAMPKAQLGIELRRSSEVASSLADRGDIRGLKTYQSLSTALLAKMRDERTQVENDVLNFQKSGDKYADTLRGASLLKRLDQLNSKIANEEANLKIVEAALAADSKTKAAEDLQRETMLKTVDKLQAQQALAAEGRDVGILSQFGTRGQLESALSEYSTKMREAAAARDRAAAEMKAAAEDGREEAFDEAKEKYQTQLSLLDTLAGFRGSIGQALSQMIASSMPNYTGLQANELGQLAAIGGFGSASAAADLSLDMTRQQVELLREILRKIPEDTAALYS